MPSTATVRPPAPTIIGPTAIIRPPAPVVVGPGQKIATIRQTIAPVARAIPAAGITRRPIYTWRREAPGNMRSLPGIHGLGQVNPPPTPQIETLLLGGAGALDMACDSCRNFLAWCEAGALTAYEKGRSPESVWGSRAIAKTIARSVLVAGGLLAVRQALNAGTWVWVVEGDTLAAWQTAELTRSAGGTLGWIPNSYVTGGEDRRVGILDSIGFAAGMFGLTSIIAGVGAATEVATEAAIASADDIARAAAGVPAAARAAGAGGSPEAAARAGRGMFDAAKMLLASRTSTETIKWTAIAVAASIAAGKIPSAIDSFHGGKTRVSEAAADAANKVVLKGLEDNDPDMVKRGLDAMTNYQREAGEEEKYVWAVGGLVAGKLLLDR